MRFTELYSDSPQYNEYRKATHTDCIRLLNAFSQQNDGSFLRFANVWNDLKFGDVHYIHLVAQNIKSRPAQAIELARRRLYNMFYNAFQDILCDPSETFIIRLGALYGQYLLFHTQRFEPMEYFKVEAQQLEQMLSICKEIHERVNGAQAIQILHDMCHKSKCFHYVAAINSPTIKSITCDTTKLSETSGNDLPKNNTRAQKRKDRSSPRYIIPRYQEPIGVKLQGIVSKLRTMATTKSITLLQESKISDKNSGNQPPTKKPVPVDIAVAPATLGGLAQALDVPAHLAPQILSGMQVGNEQEAQVLATALKLALEGTTEVPLSNNNDDDELLQFRVKQKKVASTFPRSQREIAIATSIMKKLKSSQMYPASAFHTLEQLDLTAEAVIQESNGLISKFEHMTT